jgi:ubiquinone/menaquinone biosynthesis C-methylase UbiE
MSTDHTSRVVDQFTKLADAFGNTPQLTDSQSLDLLLSAAVASESDSSLDVACGAGVVACHFARTVSTAEGIDITPAMLTKARERQRLERLTNLTWTHGDATELPYPDNTFTIVTSRYAIHHMPSPVEALQEMTRVCTIGGRIVVADICLSDDPIESGQFDHFERMNDPSHVRALTEAEWLDAFREVQLQPSVMARYRLEFSLRRILQAASMPAQRIWQIDGEMRAAVSESKLAGHLSLQGDDVYFAYPIAVFAALKRVAVARRTLG